MKKFIVLFSILTVSGFLNQSFAEDYEVIIPFGAYNPELNTPAEVWYDPPLLVINIDDSATWLNNDREGHTVTSGQGAGRFGWMDTKQNFGKPDGIFASGRFMPGESWSHKFEDPGRFEYFCTIHPWMEGIIVVEPKIPDYPHDALGNRFESFPIIEYTKDGLIELDMSWEPNVIRTHEKVSFIYQTYDPSTNSNLDKMEYDISIIQNGKEIFRDEGLTQVGGDYRNFIFDEAGPIEIRIENIVSGGTSGIESGARAIPEDPTLRTVKFSTLVYDNPEKTHHTETIIQPKQTFRLYYEIATVIILIPAAIFIFIIWRMKTGKPKVKSTKSSPI